MKTREILLIAAVALLLYLLTRRQPAAGTGAGGVVVDPYAQRIDSSVNAVSTLWNIGTSLFGGGAPPSSGYPSGVTDYNPAALADPTLGSGAVSFDE